MNDINERTGHMIRACTKLNLYQIIIKLNGDDKCRDYIDFKLAIAFYMYFGDRITTNKTMLSCET